MKSCKKVGLGILLVLGLATAQVCAFEYNVRRPSDDLKPTYHVKDTVPCVWTLAVEDAIRKAKASGKYTILLNTASWWCPYCETLEELVLTSNEWKAYVEEKGFYLAVMDFPYRGKVSDDQLWKSVHPELGDGWGFQCWLMDPEWLAEIGLSAEEGLAAIMSEYELQASYALPVGASITLKRWDTQEDFVYHKLGYPTIIVIGPDGEEVGRGNFPWWSSASVTRSEAQEYVFQMLERIINGECEICQDKVPSIVDISSVHTYDGWMVDADGVLAGTMEIKTAKHNGRKNTIRARLKVSLKDRTIRFPSVETDVGGCVVCGDELTINTFEFDNGGAHASVNLGAYGLSGTLVCAGEVYTIKGGCNLYKEKDAQSKAIVATGPVGVWSLVVNTTADASGSPFSKGYGAIAMDVKRTGKARFTGYMGDGTKVSCKSQVIMGSNGIACVPFVQSLYDKRGGVSFAIWFKNGKLFNIESISKWVSDGNNHFEAEISVRSTMSNGTGTVSEGLDLSVDGLPESLDGLAFVNDQSVDYVTTKGRNWSGTSITGFKASYFARTGLLNGGMAFQVRRNNGSIKKVRGKFRGVVMGGSGYGSVIVDGVGAWPVKISACGSCSE